MQELPSAEFRKRYAKLTEATVVTVNGHPIGLWQPAVVKEPEGEARRTVRPVGTQSAQAARDELLRKINRGG